MRVSSVTVTLRPLALADEKAFLKLARRSRALHKPWIAVPTTSKQFLDYVEEMNTEDDQAFLVWRKDTQDMVGVVELRDIFYGDFQNAYLLYYAFAGQMQQGCMTQAVQHVIRHAFHSLKLHRLEANIQPDNHASLRLIRACGFDKEGFSPKFLKKAGQWRDHERWALVKT
ncbi:MAG: GNAT family N-acetyltransferase [Limnohabitans sp.]